MSSLGWNRMGDRATGEEQLQVLERAGDQPRLGRLCRKAFDSGISPAWAMARTCAPAPSCSSQARISPALGGQSWLEGSQHRM
jgi:hypothetical protein